MKLLTGREKDVGLEIGFSTTLPQPRLGYVAAVRAPKPDLPVEKLSVDPGDFRLLNGGRPLADYPYMVLEVTASAIRPDWHQIPELASAYKRVQEEYRAGRETATAEALTMFRRVALTCNDLLDSDARQLVDKVMAQYTLSGPPDAARRGPGAAAKALPDLKAIQLYQ
jgi:hypothetical protein